MRFLILIGLLVAGCYDMPERASSIINDGRLRTCQDACRAMGATSWGYAPGSGHFQGCLCMGPMPELPVCPPRRPADGGSCE